MEQKLVATTRNDAGKGVARKLRADGSVPGVLYGLGQTAVPLAVDAKELSKILHTGAGSNVLLDLVVDGEDHLVMPREIQRDRLHDRLVHVDFLAVSRNAAITVTVPIEVIGTSPGVKAGGVLEHLLWEVQVSCLPGDVPDSIQVDVSAVEIGDVIKVANVPLPKGVTMLSHGEDAVVSVVVPQSREVPEGEAVAEAAAASAGGAAPEAASAAAEEGGEG